jgi:membrane-associated phospholipid phosphatase
MRFLKEIKSLIYIACLLPVFLFYLDKVIVRWMKYSYKYMEIHRLFKYIDPYVDIVGNGLTLILFAFLLFLFGKYVNSRFYEVGRSLFTGLLTAGLVVQILKHLMGRARPRLTHDSVFIGPSFQSSYDSFPSGHTVMVFCLAHILSRRFPKYKILFYLFALIVGFDRIGDISHFPSDVLAGMVIGLLIAKIMSEKIMPLNVPTSQ